MLCYSIQIPSILTPSCPVCQFQSYESRGGGKYSSGYKAKGKYKAKSGSKETHAEGGAVIPICLPLCCGAACSVM